MVMPVVITNLSINEKFEPKSEGNRNFDSNAGKIASVEQLEVGQRQ